MAESNNATDIAEILCNSHNIIGQEEILKLAEIGFDELQSHLKKKCNEWEETKVSIALIGAACCGKSSLINTIRGLEPRDEGAAEVGIFECTIEPTPYEFPNNKLCTLWDLPGVGVEGFSQETYMDKIDVSR